MFKHASKAVEASQLVHPLANSDFCGWLTKEGSLIKSWRRRFFVVKGTDLFYYPEEPVSGEEPEPIGCMSLVNAEIEQIPPKKEHEFCFIIKTDERRLTCSADGGEEMDDWVETLRMCATSIEEEDAWQKPDFQGFLTKKGSNAPTWKKRWFVLKGANLYYFKDELGPLNLDIRPLGLVPLDHCIVEESVVKSNGFFFVVASPQRRLEVYSDTAENRAAWIAALRSASVIVGGGGMNWQTDVDWSGFLYKKGANNPGWKRRWFALRGHLLYYFKNVPEGEVGDPRGAINTAGGSVDEKNNLGRDFGFAIVQRNPLRTYYLAADSVQERYDWMSQILLSLCRED